MRSREAMSPQWRDFTQVHALLVNEPVHRVRGTRRQRRNQRLPPGALVATCPCECLAGGPERVLEEDIGIVVAVLESCSGAVNPRRRFDGVAAWLEGAVEHQDGDVVRDEGAGGGEAG